MGAPDVTQATLPPSLRTDDLFEALQARILSDEWPAGARLPGERELAESYDTNRNTLREAIRRLEQAGLVTVRHGQGLTVTDFRRTGSLELASPFIVHGRDLKEKAQIILDLLEPRKRVLEYVVERFIDRFEPSDLVELEDATRAIRAAEAARSAEGLISSETDFYEALVRGTRDQIARWMARPLLDLNRDIQTRFSALVQFEPSLSQFTSQLLSATVARDKPGALALLRQHYDTIDEKVEGVLAPLVGSKVKGKVTP